MSKLSTEEINHICSSVDIVDVISKYIPLIQRGKNFFGVCPFHDDHSPSMSVSKDKQIYKCFSCGATGNVLKFVMDYENISFMEAIKNLADKAGISVNIDFKAIPSTNVVNKELYDIYDLSFKFYQNNLNTKEGIPAKEYLLNREINDEIIKSFAFFDFLFERSFFAFFWAGRFRQRKDDGGVLQSVMAEWMGQERGGSGKAVSMSCRRTGHGLD